MKFWETFLGFDPNREKVFPGQQPGEEVELMTAFHWMSLVPFLLQLSAGILFLMIFYFLTDFFNGLSSRNSFFLVMTSLALVIHLLCYRLYNYFLKVLVITNYRVITIRHTVILSREREVISLQNIQDLQYHQTGILPRIFKYGTLEIYGASSEIKCRYAYVPHVNKIHHLLGEIQHRASLMR